MNSAQHQLVNSTQHKLDEIVFWCSVVTECSKHQEEYPIQKRDRAALLRSIEALQTTISLNMESLIAGDANGLV
ncbi:hypothetical protein [Vibrio gazogenes]|uniref:Uncharacterized protein n=1 Tax=Vibrio gazogenes DSM 21264 = NBRC 103151 TaxID=1123492 RepID=A0A1M5HLF9_VIBGA|nr:hypothetical protein [Vibrio gazogenes]USP14504.1 hypothetical protein MKS89_04060 [Vibrio gazogenes]SHG16682.1 hypothetical protein SAMN02745781_04130 [Vibrio gazogenes DSM 21264] [Vibrio gazogenes DSM 21264 = NBRC 103151]SJN57664.1 hypothetical protein BQ6471_02652 [Vibrio gazogenes]